MPNTVVIYLSGKYSSLSFICSECDAVFARSRPWYLNSNGYACAKGSKLFHLKILGKAPAGLEWDHIDRDKLNNTRGNFRAITQSQNRHNSGVDKNNTSGTRGVSFHNVNGWGARIGVNKRRIHLGWFKVKEDAIKTRKEAELKYFPEIYERLL